MRNGVYIFHMSDAAHHLDLHTPNTCDPPSVTYERFQVVLKESEQIIFQQNLNDI